VSELYIFACQRRIPEDWRPPFAPDVFKEHEVRLIQLPCSAKLSTAHMLRPFENGVDGVLVLTCEEDGCRSLEGSRRARMRVREANSVLDEVGLGSGRVMIKQAQGNGRESYTGAIEELLTVTEKLGPNPTKGSGDK
jgi:coenzyme F420-reducing hydrogenase delta subunit